jgi:ribosome-binding ATPase YchF (GTP1/OBG family)
MMLVDYIKQRQKMREQKDNFYTANGIHVYTKDQMVNDLVDLEGVVADLEAKLPDHIRDGVEMVIVGHFDEFDERGINAFYKDGALYVSNVQDDDEDLLDDLVHETAHSVEEQYGMEIYADQKIKQEFMRKREHLYNVLWKMGFKAPKEMFADIEYNQEFDEFLYQHVGYDKLSEILKGIMVSTYAATSLREYFATGFTEFYLYPSSHGYLQKTSPELYKKLVQLHKPEDA